LLHCHATLVHDNGTFPLEKSDINVVRLVVYQINNQKTHDVIEP
jgi:hypothetical protein